MKKVALILAVLSGICAWHSAEAKTLEEVLKEKGVITEEDYKEVVKSSPIKYKLGEGFNFTSADEKFSASIGGLYQIRYTMLDLDDVNNVPKKSAQDSSKFELRRIKLLLNGYAYSKDLTYKLALNFANIAAGTTSNGGLLEETWVNYRLLDELQVRVGQDKVQFGRQYLTPATALQFVDQSVVTNAFTPTYDTGMMIHGKVAGGIFNYNIAGYGGTGQNTYRATTDNAFAARITVNPLGDMKYAESDVERSEKPLLSIGSNYYHNNLNAGTEQTYGTGNTMSFMKSGTGWFGIGNTLMPAAKKFTAADALDINMFGVDTAFKFNGLSVTGEYFFGEAEGQKTHNKLFAQGFYTQAGYFIVPKTVEVAYRYSYLDPNRDVSNDHWIENAVAASWYINNHNLKLQADFTNIHKQPSIASTTGTKNTDDKQARFQVQLVF